MVTKHPRLNVTLDKEHMEIITMLAQKQGKSISAKLRELVLEALELEEDFYLSKLAEKREKETKRWHSHETVWGKNGG